MKKRFTIEDACNGLKNGDIRTLSRAISLAESSRPDDRQLIADILRQLNSKKSPASLRLAITGTPGVGKSTLINTICESNKSNKKTAVLAVDPSSEQSGGSLLGDKTRMADLANMDNVYVRPSPGKMSRGGLARNMISSIMLCEAAGFDNIIIESVGTGQSDTLVRQIADVVLLLVEPGGGDDVQGMKKGILEHADIIAVNKASGEMESKAIKTMRAYRSSSSLFMNTDRNPDYMTVDGENADSVRVLMGKIQDIHHSLILKNNLEALRTNQMLFWFDEMIKESLWNWFTSIEETEKKMAECRNRIKTGELLPFEAVKSILSQQLKSPDKE